MTEVILNDKCMHCVHKECHDGYNFCNQAMKDNSFYKNKKLYKGLEVIQRPTYEELEKENAELKESLKKWKDAIYTDVENYDEQLTKAKELLKWWVNHCGDHDLFYAEKTERFLREVENEKDFK